MKNKLSKILSSLLIASFLVSVLAVFASADANTPIQPTEERGDQFEIIYNRSFEDGWDYSNGFASTVNTRNENAVTVEYEEDNLRNYNYFLRYEAKTGGTDCYSTIAINKLAVTHSDRDAVRGTIVELSVKADDLANLGNILWMQTAVGKKNVDLLSINKLGELVVFPSNYEDPQVIDTLGNEWINLAFVFDWTTEDLNCTLYQGYGIDGGYDKTKKYSMQYPMQDDVGMLNLYLGFTKTRTATAAESVGMSVCFDNVKVYQGTTEITVLEDSEYGEVVNTLAQKTIDIKESVYDKTKAQLIEEALAMKVGVDRALVRNTRYELVANSSQASYNGAYGAPVKSGDDILVPLQLILDYIGFPSYTHTDGQSFDITTGTSKTYMTLGRSSATVDGQKVELSIAPGYIKNTAGDNYLVIALSDVPVLLPGWLALYDDMGLIIIYEDATPDNLEDNEPLVNRNDDLDTMLGTMKKFVYGVTDNVSGKEVFISNGTQLYNQVKENTGNFAHPYIIANADTFAALKAAYEGTDSTYKAYVDSIIANADKIYSENAKLKSDESYDGLKENKKPVNNAIGIGGYDSFGRLSIAVDYAEYLPVLAFAYQMTGDDKYAYMAYDWACALASWEHWGPAYMQDCAETTSAFAIGYDWLYNAYKSLGLDTEVLAEAIYNLGVHDGYIASTGAPCQHPRSASDMSVYHNKTDAQNAVATSGMIIGSLAILDYVSAKETSSYYDATIYLIGNNLANLIVNGLDIYAPDGGSVESALQWERATSNLSKMSMALLSAAGSDYGFMRTWAIDKTCYYAVHIESSDNVIWNYHDGGGDGVSSDPLASLNTDMFNYVAKALGDSNLYAVRRDQIASGKSASIYDIIFYPFDGVPESAELTLDYYVQGVEVFVSRSDWAEGSMYTGLMGGSNEAGGQLDAGNFIYHNKGIAWIVDLGTENPAIQEYYTAASRYKFYRASSEGQNVLLMTSKPDKVGYGQYSGGEGIMTKTYTNEFGSYAILDNTTAYLNLATYANRGILVTNNRDTVVVQDEFSFVIVETLVWAMHTAANVTIDEDANGRVAYLQDISPIDGKSYTVRATIVSQRPDLRFNISDTDTRILSNNVTNKNEYSRSDFTRLTIESTTILFELAVVFELMDDTTEEQTPVRYTWTRMNEWEPVESSEGAVDTGKTRSEADKTNVKTGADKLATIFKGKDPFENKLEEIYKYLTLVAYTMKSFKKSELGNYASAYKNYEDYVDDYEEFLEFIYDSQKATNGIAKSLMGVNLEEEEPEEE